MVLEVVGVTVGLSIVMKQNNLHAHFMFLNRSLGEELAVRDTFNISMFVEYFRSSTVPSFCHTNCNKVSH